MENSKPVLSSVLVAVQENGEHTSGVLAAATTDNNAGGGSDVVLNREQEQQMVPEDPMLETDEDEDDSDDDDDDSDDDDDDDEGGYEEYDGPEERHYADYDGEEVQEQDGESDNESCTSCVSPKRFEFFSANGLIEVPKGDKEYTMITEKFFTDLGELGKNTNVLAIQKNMFFGPSGQARKECFTLFSQAMARKRGGDSNVKCAWYGSSKDGISEIISYGFGKCGKPDNNELYGLGIYLTPQEASIERIMGSPIDENGFRHVLLCRVILGNMEQVCPGSKQFHPSSEAFDSGVDNLLFPKKYIVWSTSMNTHIFPEYVISFKAPISLEGFRRAPNPVPVAVAPAMAVAPAVAVAPAMAVAPPAVAVAPVVAVARPNSAWMPFGTLILVLSKCLQPRKMGIIMKYHIAFREGKINRTQLIQLVRHTAGDYLLAKLIKAFKARCAAAGAAGIVGAAGIAGAAGIVGAAGIAGAAGASSSGRP